MNDEIKKDMDLYDFMNDGGINVLSLFDGMSCGMLALDEAGIKVNNYFASEIDKFPMFVSNKNYPGIIQLGDVCGWKSWDLPKIDLIIGGSPCQGFSRAGIGLNFDDSRSKLFFEFVDIIKHFKPKYFLLENVKMKKEWQDIISEYLGVEPIEINSNLVSAQNRKRLYWTNISGVGKPEDKNVLIEDILETKNNSLFLGCAIRGRYKSNGKTHQILELNGLKKSNCLTSVQKDSMYVELIFDSSVKLSETSIVSIVDDEIRIKNATKKGFLVAYNYSSINFTCPNSKTRRGRVAHNKSNTLDTQCNQGILLNLKNNFYFVRKFTALECERLQTVPDNYTEGVSNSQRFKMLGNGWTIGVISHLFKCLRGENT